MQAMQSLEYDTAFSAGADTNQCLTFLLDDTEYGVDILRVQEIKGWESVTQIPNTPPYIKGVINIRGTIVPLIDLRERFGLAHLDYGPTTVVIVLKVLHERGSRIMGIVVDAVSDVYTMASEQMQPPPNFGSAISMEFIQGLATVNDKMIIVLGIDHLLNSGDLAVLGRMMA